MDTHVLLLTIQFSLAAVAIICAINARDVGRIIASWFLAILILCAAVFHTTQFVVSKSTVPEKVVEALPPPPPVVEPAPVKEESTITVVSENSEAKIQLESTLEAALKINRTLSSISLQDMENLSDSEYEGLQQKAMALMAESKKLKSKFVQIPNASDVEGGTILGKGIDALIAACNNYERYFKAENQTEERERVVAIQSNSRQAGSLLQQAQSALK